MSELIDVVSKPGDFVEQVKILVDNGANLNVKNKKGTPLLMCALFYKNYKIVNYLIPLVKDVEDKADNESTNILIFAAFHGNDEIIDNIFKYHPNTNLNHKDNFGNTALSTALTAGKQNLAKKLYKLGARDDQIDLINGEFISKNPDEKRFNLDEVDLDDIFDKIKNKKLFNIHILHGVNPSRIDVISLLLDLGADPNSKSKTNTTILMRACRRSCYETVKLLLKHGADPNIKNKYGLTPLMLAVHVKDNVNIIKELLKFGANQFETDSDGNTIQMIAVNSHSMEVLKLFSYENINQVNNMGNSIIDFALANFPEKIVVEFLLNNGANPNNRNSFGCTPLMVAVSDLGNYEIVKLLVDKGASITARDSFDQTALMNSIVNEFEDCFNLLLSLETDQDKSNFGGDTILTLACLLRNEYMVVEILKKFPYFDVHHANFRGENAFNLVERYHLNETILKLKLRDDIQTIELRPYEDSSFTKNLLASLDLKEKNSLKIAKELLNNGADINYRYDGGKTFLMIAIEERASDFVDFAINNGANIHIKDNIGRNALMYACEFKGSNFVKKLLEMGADGLIIDDFGNTCLSIAVHNHNLKVISSFDKKLFNLYDCHRNTPLSNAIDDQKVNIVRELLKFGANPNFKTNTITPLCRAVLRNGRNSLKIVKELIKYGADIYGKSNNHTPLMESIIGKNYRCFNYLLDLEPKNSKYKDKLLWLSCDAKENVFNYILHKFPDVDLNVKMYQNTPLFIASTVGNVNIVKRLLKLGVKPE